MTSPTGWTRRLVEGLAVYLDAHTSAVYLPPPAVPAANDTAITIGFRPAKPARLVVLTPYISDHATIVDTVGLQVWYRALPGDVLDLMDEVDETLNGLEHLTLSTGIRVARIDRRHGDDVGADQGVDGAGLANRVTNHYVKAMRTWPQYTA